MRCIVILYYTIVSISCHIIYILLCYVMFCNIILCRVILHYITLHYLVYERRGVVDIGLHVRMLLGRLERLRLYYIILYYIILYYIILNSVARQHPRLLQAALAIKFHHITLYHTIL